MRKRVRFSKQGNLKYIGHLDMQRLLQRAMRKAHYPLAYSQGYNPHPLISFAQPLSLGFTSDNEYMDMRLKEDVSHEQLIASMNAILPEGVEFLEVIDLPEGAPKAMAAVEAARYHIVLDRSLERDKMEEFFKQEEILVEKLTKKKRVKTVDLKAGIIDLQIKGQQELELLCSAGNNNLKPQLLIESLYKFCGENCNFKAIVVNRMDLYTASDKGLISLIEVGQ